MSGTPESACNRNTQAVANTGADASCVSRFGALDMVGNLAEWVADWDEVALSCTILPAEYGSDLACVGEDGSTDRPAALVRGGAYNGSAAYMGPFAVTAVNEPSVSSVLIGFRGAR